MENNTTNTYHAIAERLSEADIRRQAGIISRNQLLEQAFDSTNIPIIAVNRNRQLVYANRIFLNVLGLMDSSSILGLRPGESVNCIHAGDNSQGCGTSESCRYCNAVNLILKSIKEKDANKGEVIVTVRHKGIEIPMNMYQNVEPIYLENEVFYVISFIDASDIKKRKMLERVFFHDIINTAGGLKGLLNMLKLAVPADYQTKVDEVENYFEGLIDEIMSQRLILQAEENELKPELLTLKSIEIAENIAMLYRNNEIIRERQILISKDSQNIEFRTDPVLLKRILGNMLKNAIEATDKKGTIVLGCKKTVNEDKSYVEFWVNNKGVMPRDVQLQVFKYSYSTKGVGRGLGTYSMKLFGERFLKGRVGFTSDEETGTTFYVRLPMEELN